MIKEIIPNFYRIILPMPFELKHVNIYALTHGNEIALFDAGYNSRSSWETLEKDLESIGLSIKSVRDIYLSHMHVDHCGMAGLIREKSQATIHLSEIADQNSRHYQEIDVLLPRMKKFYLAHGLDKQEAEKLVVLLRTVLSTIYPFQSNYNLQANEIREFGKWRFEVISTPGHTNSHICFYFRQEGILLSGDTILPQITPNLGPDALDENYRPLQSFLESLNTVGGLPIRKIYPGHGNVLEDAQGRIKEMREHHNERSQLILSCLGTAPKTTSRIAQEIFGGNLSILDKLLALNETYSHLLELRHNGKIREEQNGNVLVYSGH